MSEVKLTPMMVQYHEIKKQYEDCLLFYRLGDFYELFYEDAEIASKELEIALTSRNKNSKNPVPMCGVPHHAAQEPIKTLVDRGYKVAICEQLEEATPGKKMVKRGVVQVITPGTVLESKNRDDKNNYYLSAVTSNNGYHLAYVDVVSGDIKVTSVDEQHALLSELSSIQTSEIVIEEPLSDWMMEQFQNRGYVISTQEDRADLTHIQHVFNDVPMRSGQQLVTQLLLSYVVETQKRDLIHLKTIEVYETNEYLALDYNAKVNLELTQSSRTLQRKGSLLWLLDKTQTAMGGRLLKTWIEKPLIDAVAIQERLDRVDNLMHHYFERWDIQSILNTVYDLERVVARVSFGSANAKDLNQLKRSLQQLPLLVKYLESINEDQIWQSILADLPDVSDLTTLIDSAIVENPGVSVTDGDIIQDGFNELLDSYRDASKNGKQWLLQLRDKERERTGIKTLKIGFNRNFGYYIEITNGQLHLLPEGLYERKQTLTNAERFTTPEIKEKERLILEADEKSAQLEYDLFVSIRETVKTYSRTLQTIARAVAQIDVLQSFARVSEDNHYVKPEITNQQKDIMIVEGRHPIVETVIGFDQYIPNDIVLNDDKRLMLITGPNMSGKSTYMRQLALCVIMAQIGCYVAATQAQLPIIDKIFTRIGAADDLTLGQSTFMVEMVETNLALRHASENSLLLFDEIGRGTATYDGMALAEAILKYVDKNLSAKALFSTHYHELTQLEEELSGLFNMHVGAVEEQGQLTFLHQVKKGPADKSYGIHVAQLAGLPHSLIQEATRVLAQLEKNGSENFDEQLLLFEEDVVMEQQVSNAKGPAISLSRGQRTDRHLMDNATQNVMIQMKDINVNTLTPLEALTLLNEWQQQLNGKG